MSDYQDFCESFGGCASDPGFMDEWMQKYLSVEDCHSNQKISTEDTLPKGKLVHIIKLITSHPAKPVGIIWNKKLPDNLSCKGANCLRSTDYDDPASWFVRKGFTVRSSKNDGFWYQVAFKNNHSDTYLPQSELKEYESICSALNSDWVINERD